MEQITFEDTAKELVRQLEDTLGRLALAADASISTSGLESKAQKLAGKLKASAELFNGLSLYKDVKGSEIWNWTVAEKLPDNLFPRYASLAKRCHEGLEVFVEENLYFAKVSDNLFVNLADLPEVELPQFKVKLEGNTLMAVRADLLLKLPESIKKLMSGKEES